jgi:hypothetical protein
MVDRTARSRIGPHADALAALPQAPFENLRMPRRHPEITMRDVNATYAVVWREGDDPVGSGRLEVRPRDVVLDGAVGGRPVLRMIPLAGLQSIRVGRTREDRLSDRPSLVLEPRVGPVIRVASVAQPGIVSELAKRLVGMRIGCDGPQRALVVLPLKPGTRERAAELVSTGPPFDPADAGLARHSVFLVDDAAVFLFEAADGSLEQLLVERGLWQAADAWREIVAGPPQLADDAYSWEAPPPALHGLGF